MNNKRIISFFIIFNYIIFFSLVVNASDKQSDKDDIIIKVHNVGEGNFITVKSDTDCMIVDAGSASFSKEFQYIDGQKKEREKLNISPSSASIHTPDSQTKSFTKNLDGPTDKVENLKKDAIKKIRNHLGLLPIDNSFHVPKLGKKKAIIKAVIVTHPDKDHYGWLPSFLSAQHTDKIEKIFLGGLHKKYIEDDKFFEWLKQWSNTDIYFLAHSLKPFKHSDLNELKEKITTGDDRYDQEYHTKNIGEDDKAFGIKLGDAKVSFLTINPTHWKGVEKILRTNYPDDTNSDSTIIKVTHKENSIILTGDATHLTTQRVIDNYSSKKEDLKAEVIVASHHGASSKGSNNKEWLAATNPNIVLISSGYGKTHPRLASYDNFRPYASLLSKKHQVYVVDRDKKEKESEKIKKIKYKQKIHTTNRAIFSTFTSGNITIKLPSTGFISMKTSLDENIELDHLQPQELVDSDVEEVSGEEDSDGNAVRVTPSPKISSAPTITNSSASNIDTTGMPAPSPIRSSLDDDTMHQIAPLPDNFGAHKKYYKKPFPGTPYNNTNIGDGEKKKKK